MFASIPESFLQTTDNFVLESIKVGTDTIPVNLRFKFSKQRPWPTSQVVAHGLTKANSWRSEYIITSEVSSQAPIDELIEELKVWRKSVADAQSRQAEYVSSVKAVIESYATLSPALKAWPPLWDLLPLSLIHI